MGEVLIQLKKEIRIYGLEKYSIFLGTKMSWFTKYNISLNNRSTRILKKITENSCIQNFKKKTHNKGWYTYLTK